MSTNYKEPHDFYLMQESTRDRKYDECACGLQRDNPMHPDQVPIDHVGKWADRLTPEANNPREVAFAEEWKRENEPWHRRGVDPTLAVLLHTRHARPDEVSASGSIQTGRLTQEEATLAATVVQWLGSNIGMSFLESALRRCGYKIERLKD